MDDLTEEQQEEVSAFVTLDGSTEAYRLRTVQVIRELGADSWEGRARTSALLEMVEQREELAKTVCAYFGIEPPGADVLRTYLDHCWTLGRR